MKTNEQLEQAVAERWRPDFWRFVKTGEADPAFLEFLDRDEGVQRALDEALQAEADRIHALGGPEAAPARKPRRWGWMGHPVLVRLYVAAALALVPGLLIAGLYWWGAYAALQQVAYVAPPKPAGGTAGELAQAQKQNEEKKDEAARVAVDHLDSPDPAVRTEAARLLAAIGPRAAKAVPGVFDKLRACPNPDDDPALAASLYRAMTAIDPSAAAMVAPPATDWRLLFGNPTDEEAEIAQEKKLEAAMKKLDAEDPEERSNAAGRLAVLGDKARRVFPDLVKRWEAEKDPRVKEEIGDALKSIDLEAAEAANIPIKDAEKVELTLLRERNEVELSDHEVVVTSLQGLGDGSIDARRDAAEALSRIGSAPPAAVLVLQKKFADEKDPSVRSAIGKALEVLDPAAAETVKGMPPAAAALPPN